MMLLQEFYADARKKEAAAPAFARCGVIFIFSGIY